MKKIKISAVSYLNTYPFIYGIFSDKNLRKNIEITTDYPSVCADKLKTNKVDLGLIPVAELEKIPNYSIVSDFCISAVKKVRSVMLYSEVELKNIKTILLDYQSRTSIKLVQILASEFWHISPYWKPAKKGFCNKISGNTAAVLIGDKALNKLNNFNFQYDLAEEWFKFAKLPFVFATWTANKKLSDKFLKNFNKSLKFGVNNIENTLKFFKKNVKEINYNARKYLLEDIDFILDRNKITAINLFQKYIIKHNLNLI